MYSTGEYACFLCEIGSFLCESVRFLRDSVSFLRDFAKEFAYFLCEIGSFRCGSVRFLRQFARADDQYLGESTVDLDEFRLNFARIPVEVRPYSYKIHMEFNVNCPWNSLEFTVNYSSTDLAAGGFEPRDYLSCFWQHPTRIFEKQKMW